MTEIKSAKFRTMVISGESLGMKITECYSLHVGNYILRKKKI